MMVLQLSTWQWALALTGAAVIGLAKAGLKGADMINVTLMALVFGGKASTGIVLPLLCLGDVLAVRYYHRHAQWSYFWKLIPWMAMGILIGVYAGQNLPEALFRRIMAIIIVITALMLIGFDKRRQQSVPQNIWFTGSMGLAAGITTMLGNLAGAFSNVYFLAMRLPKNHFIGTAAWVFLVINLFKLPFQVIFWKNINGNTLFTSAVLAPALLLGFAAGIKLVRLMPEEAFRKWVVSLTLTGAVFIFLK